MAHYFVIPSGVTGRQVRQLVKGLEVEMERAPDGRVLLIAAGDAVPVVEGRIRANPDWLRSYGHYNHRPEDFPPRRSGRGLGGLFDGPI
jgi:hypothetical protein